MLLILQCIKETQYSEFGGPGFSSIYPDRRTSKDIITAVSNVHMESCKKVPIRYMPFLINFRSKGIRKKRKKKNEKLTYQ